MAAPAAGFDEGAEDPRPGDRIIGSFGMPLDAHHESTVLRLDGFDHTVRCGRDDVEAARIIEGLYVMAVNDAFEPSTAYGVGGAVAMLIGGLEMVGQMLVEMAAGVKTHHLHSQADSKYREVRCRLLEPVEQLEFEGLAIGRDEGRGWMNRLIEACSVRIVATAHDHPIEMRDDLGGGSGAGEDGNRDPAGVGDASGVTSSQPDLIVDEIGGDTDERSAMRGR